MDLVNAVIGGVCYALNVNFVQLWDLLDLETDYDDDVHLNKNGYLKWFSRIKL